MITAAAVTAAQAARNFPYETRSGEVVKATPVSEIVSALRDKGWRNVGRLDRYDLKDMGLTVVEAQYVGGARKTGRFVEAVVYTAA